ncbi:MAG: hypothetical protein IPK80_07245 [Nannocystis sp.]|nr:hypothetical protein [Nannocystis sp.]
MSPPLEPTTPRAALHALFIELFTAQELRWWLRSGEDANIIAELPEEGPLAALAERALTALESRGQIDTGFFARLAAERPGKKAAIAAVAEHWCAIEPATTPRPRAKSSLIKSRRETPYPPEQKRHEIVLRGERRADVIRWGLHVHGEAKAEASFDVAGVQAALHQATGWLRAPKAAMAAALGETLGRLLFGDESDPGLQRALRRLFGRPKDAEDLVLRPAYAPVRARIVVEDPGLRGLPWPLAALDGRLLADDGWTFEVADDLDLDAHVRLPGSCSLLVIAPHAVAPEIDIARHLRELDELLARIWPLVAERGRLAEHRLIARTEAEIAKIYRDRRQPEVIYVVGKAQLITDEEPRIVLDGEYGGSNPVGLDALVRGLGGAQVVFLNLLGRGLQALASAPLEGPSAVVVPLAAADGADVMDVGLAWLEALLRRGFGPVEALDAALCEGAGERAALMLTRTRFRTWKTSVAPTVDFARKVPVRLDRSAQRTRLFDKLVDFAGGPQRLLSVVVPAPPDQRPERLGAILLQHVQERLRGRDLHLLDRSLPFPDKASGARLRTRLERNLSEGLLDRRDDETLERALARFVEDDARQRGLARGTRRVLWIDWQQIGRSPGAPVTAELLETWLAFGADVAAQCPSSVKILSLVTAVASPGGCAAIHDFLGRELLEAPIGRTLISESADFITLPTAGDLSLHDLHDYLNHHASCPNDLVVPAASAIFAETGGNYEKTVTRLEEIERSVAWSSLAATAPLPGKSTTSSRTFT